MKNDGDYSLHFSFVKVTCTFLGHCLPCGRMCKAAVWKTKGSLWCLVVRFLNTNNTEREEQRTVYDFVSHLPPG